MISRLNSNSKSKRRSGTYRATRLEQLEALASPARMELLESFERLGAASIAEVARALGRKPASLYFHLHKLVDVGLLVKRGSRRNGKRDELLYATPKGSVGLVHDADNPSKRAALARGVSANLRLTERDLKRSLERADTVVSGVHRSTYCGRQTGWLTRTELAEANRLLARLDALLVAGERRPRTRLHALTFAITPLDPDQRS